MSNANMVGLVLNRLPIGGAWRGLLLLSLRQRIRQEIRHYNARHNIIPGMTGWPQVNGFRGAHDLFPLGRRVLIPARHAAGKQIPKGNAKGVDSHARR